MPGYRAWGLCALLICSACSGDDFTSGSGNTGGQSSGGQTSGGSGGSGGVSTGGTAGTSSGGVAGSVSGGSGGEAGLPPPLGGAAGVAGGGTGGVGPATCDLQTAQCPPGMYCDAVACGVGTCKPKPTDEDGSYQPVCGCNGITYWNASVAARHGESVKDEGACTSNAEKCPASICPGTSKCKKTVFDQAACGGPALSATCWMLPQNCTGADLPKAFGCENGCLSMCLLISMQDQYFGEGCN